MNNRLELPVLLVRQPIGEFFIASIGAHDLVNISYFDVRRLVKDERDVESYLGIQRPVNPNRIRKLKKYVESPDATFPTAVVIAVDEKCAVYDSENKVLILSPFIPHEALDEEAIPFQQIAKVIDGQHRIAAFFDDSENWNFDFDEIGFDINLAIFVGADVAQQANIFATVNLAQTKVNKSLVYDLTELAHMRSPQRTCHNVAVLLDKERRSPLFQRIKRLGTATPGRKKEPLTQAAFVEALLPFISSDPDSDRLALLRGKKLKKASIDELEKLPFRNLFIENSELDIAEILFNYFLAVEKKWPNSWSAVEKTGNLLPRSNAFKALMKFLKDDIYGHAVKGDYGSVPSVATFSKYLRPIDFPDDAFTTSKFAPGSGGQSMFLRMLRGEVSLADMLEQ